MKTRWIGLTDKEDETIRLDSLVNKKGFNLTWYPSVKEIKGELLQDKDSVIFLKHSESYDIYQICKEFSLKFPLASIILLIPEQQMDLKKALRAGARDVARIPIELAELEQIIKEVESEQQFRDIPMDVRSIKQIKNGKIITVCSTKGGVGKSTIAVNLAIALTRQKKHVAVLDLDLQFGDVAIMYDEKPKRTIYEWVKEEYGNGRSIDNFMIHHKSGVNILAAPLRPEFSEEISEEHIKVLLGELKQHYDLVIIDTPPYFTETVLTALENSEEILLVTCMDIPTLKSSKLCIETLESLNIKDRIKVILNRETKVKGLQPLSVENTLGVPVFARIPGDFKLATNSMNNGIPFLISHPKAGVSKNVISLAEKLTNMKLTVRKQPLLKRLKVMFKG